MNEIPIEKLQELLSYNPETGIITRIFSYHNSVRVDQQFSCDHTIKIMGVTLRPARVAWALYYGKWPPKDYWIDHINGRKTDNRIINLRLATPSQNQQNRAGYSYHAKGISWRNRKTKPWQAKIRVNGSYIHIGSYATEKEAAAAYKDAAIKYHGEFACYD